MNQAGSANPGRVAQALRQMKTWTGVTGKHTFEGDGGISKPIVLNVARRGDFEYFMRTVADEDALRVGLIADPGGITDSGFNQLAWEGMQSAGADFGVFIDFLNTRGDADFAANIETLVDKRYDLIVTVGSAGAEAVEKAAQTYRYQPFAVIDVNSVTEPNVLNSQFAVDEASFMAGYLAAAATRAGKQDVPDLENQRADTFLSLNAGRGTDVRFAWEKLREGSPDGYTLMMKGAVAVINGEQTPEQAADALQAGLA